MSKIIYLLDSIIPFIIGLFFLIISFLKKTKNSNLFLFLSLVILLFSIYKFLISINNEKAFSRKKKEDKYHLTYADSMLLVQKFKSNPQYLMIKNEKQKEVYDMYINCLFDQIKNSKLTENEMFEPSNIHKINVPCLEKMDLAIDSFERNGVIYK